MTAVVHEHHGHDAAAHGHGSHASHSIVAHHFDSLEQQHQAMTLGMWAFLASEVMFFGGVFTAYAIYRWSYPEAFSAASRELNAIHGAINTAVLLTSSLTMALAVQAAQARRRKPLVGYLAATMILGTAFIVIKMYEYYEKYQHGLVPLPSLFRYHHTEHFAEVQLFFTMYFTMTAIHALHMVIGIAIMGIMTVYAQRGRYEADAMPIELIGLYWHFVDLVWIFLFPFLYLIDRVSPHV